MKSEVVERWLMKRMFVEHYLYGYPVGRFVFYPGTPWVHRYYVLAMNQFLIFHSFFIFEQQQFPKNDSTQF